MAVWRRPAFRTVMAGMLLVLAACGSPEERLSEYVAEGQAYLEDGDLARAAISFRNALRIDARNAEALFAMGRIHEQRDQARRAFAAYSEAASADPTMIEAHTGYAVLALTAGELEPVAEAAAAIREQAPGHPDGLALEAALALRDDRIDAAKAAATAALQAEPGHVNATSALAGAHRAAGDPDAAIVVIDRHFETHGPNVPLALLKVQLAAAENDAGAVEVALRELIGFAPDNPDFRLALADFYRGVGDAASAESVLREAVNELQSAANSAAALVRLVRENQGLDAAIAEIDRLRDAGRDPEATLAFLAADLQAAEGNFAAARSRLDGVIETFGRDSTRGLDAVTALAALDHTTGDVAAAEERLAFVLENDAGHRGANYIDALLKLEARSYPEAITAARQSLQADPNWAPALKLLAEAHRRAGNGDLAIDALARAVESRPNDIEAASALATLLANRGDLDASLRVWDLVLQQSSEPTPALTRTAELAIQQENWGRASADIERLLETPGGEFSGALLAGSLRLAQDDLSGARQWFERAQSIDPRAQAPVLGLVRTHLAEDDIPGALERLRDHISQRPGDTAPAYNLVAQLHARLGEFDAAVDAYRDAIAASPTWATPYRELAQLHERRGRTDTALAVLDEGIADGVPAETLLLSRAFLLQRVDRPEDAIATYARMLDAGNDSDVVVNNYAALVADYAYDDPVAMERAKALAERFENSNEAYFLDTLGWVLYRAGDATSALTHLRRAVALRPDDPQLQWHVGAAMHAVGSTAQALAALEGAVVDGANYPGVAEARRLRDDLRARVEAISTEGTGS